MSEAEIILYSTITTAIGGALGAKITGATPWKGALVILASTLIIAGVVIMLEMDNLLLSTAAQLSLVILIGSAMRFTVRQCVFVAVGGLITAIVGGLLIPVFSSIT